MVGARHIAELNTQTHSLVCRNIGSGSCHRSLAGAGGVGGLSWVTLHTSSGPGAGTHFCVYDGNGNVVALVSASDGSPTTRYEYGPFAEPIRLTGPAANQNPFRFSTKRTDLTTDVVLYEYRAYNPTFGRWLSRDPIAEFSFRTGSDGLDNVANLYLFCVNDPPNKLDKQGLLVLTFSSGWSFRDPVYASIGSHIYSGFKAGTSAFYYGWGSPWGTSICNSGPLFLDEVFPFPTETTSFLKAWMISLCHGRYRVTCNAELNVYVWGTTYKKAFYTRGQIRGGADPRQ